MEIVQKGQMESFTLFTQTLRFCILIDFFTCFYGSTRSQLEPLLSGKSLLILTHQDCTSCCEKHPSSDHLSDWGESTRIEPRHSLVPEKYILRILLGNNDTEFISLNGPYKTVSMNLLL